MTLYFATILIYLVALIGVGLWKSRGVSTQEDFAVAGRSLSTFVVFGTMLATWIGTGSIFGNSEKTYQVGAAAWIVPLGELVGIAFLYMVAAKARRLRAVTVQDILETRYSAFARVLGVVTLVFTAVVIVSYQYRAASTVFQLALPGTLGPKEAKLLATVFIITYTALAGMYSVAYTDLVMGITMILGLLVTLPVVYLKAGGIAGAAAALPPDHFQMFGPIGWKEAIGILLPPALLVLGDANMYQRFFSAKSEGVAARSTIFLWVGVVVIEALIISTAFFASALEWQGGKLATPGRVIVFAARDHLPGVLGAVVMTTVLAIIVSTAISYLLVPATALVKDVYLRFMNSAASDRTVVWLSRALVACLGIIAYFISAFSEEFLNVALRAYTIYGTGVTPALLAALLWRRATTPGAIASIIGGNVVTLLWEFGLPLPAFVFQASGKTAIASGGWEIVSLTEKTGWDPVVPAIGVSVLLLVVVSLLTGRQTEKKLATFFAPSAS